MTYEEYKIQKSSFVLKQLCTLNVVPFMCEDDLL